MDMSALTIGSIAQPTKPQETQHQKNPTSFSNGVLKRHAPPPPPLQVVVYKKCLKNHAANIGGHALDGCGEFMQTPTATVTDPTSLKCAACGCHRNFHRRQPEEFTAVNNAVTNSNALTHVIEYHPHHRHHPNPPPSTAVHTAARESHSPPPISSSLAPHMLLALSHGTTNTTNITVPDTNNGYPTHVMNSGSGSGFGSGSGSGSRKRFRTKFTQEQKEKMNEFAERVGWKMMKANDELVVTFCNEIGVERGVFKVWMHNNKNTFGKRSNTTSSVSSGGANHGLNLVLNGNVDDDNHDDHDDDGDDGDDDGDDEQVQHVIHNIHLHNIHKQQEYNNGSGGGGGGGKISESSNANNNVSSSSS